jgi:hypothetical protein
MEQNEHRPGSPGHGSTREQSRQRGGLEASGPGRARHREDRETCGGLEER